MQPPLNPTPWLVLAIALLGSPTSAGAQTERADSVGAPCLNAARVCEPEPKIDDRDGMTSSTDSPHDGSFHALSAAFVIAASTDLAVSMYQIGRGAARERAFGAQWQDSPVAFAVTKSAMAAAFTYGLQRMHKDRPKTAFALGVAVTALEGWLAMRSARISPSHR
jgi:hypothetical protein